MCFTYMVQERVSSDAEDFISDEVIHNSSDAESISLFENANVRPKYLTSCCNR